MSLLAFALLLLKKKFWLPPAKSRASSRQRSQPREKIEMKTKKTITALGKKVDREEAFDIIFNFWVSAIFCPRDLNAVWSLLTWGWKPFGEMTDAEIEDFIQENCDEEILRDGANYRENVASLHG